MTTTTTTTTTDAIAAIQKALDLTGLAKNNAVRALIKEGYDIELKPYDNLNPQLQALLDEMQDSTSNDVDVISQDDIESKKEQLESSFAGVDEPIKPAAVYPVPTGYLSGNKAEIVQISIDEYSDGIQSFTSEQFNMALSLNFLTPVTAVKKSEIVKPVEVKPTRYVIVSNLRLEFEDLEKDLEQDDMTHQELIDFLAHLSKNSSHVTNQTYSIKKIGGGGTRAPRSFNGTSKAGAYTLADCIATDINGIKPITRYSKTHLVALLTLTEGFDPKKWEDYNRRYTVQGFDPFGSESKAAAFLSEIKKAGYDYENKNGVRYSNQPWMTVDQMKLRGDI